MDKDFSKTATFVHISQHHGDLVWMLVCAALVMLMQGGFCLLESGFARAKNSINVAIKNVVDFCVSMLLFWCCGFGLMFGASYAGLIGTDHFLLGASDAPSLLTFFLFQAVFCGTATTIISGALAERTRFSSYLVISVLVSGLLYPVFGHWAWGGVLPGTDPGWLSQLGFVDFAGSTVVHSLAGWSALAAAIVVGPRLGRFSRKRPPIIGHNLPMAALGTLILWFGWFGFNGGSALAVTDAVPLILLNTNLAAAAGGITALLWSWTSSRKPDVGEVLNGIIAGLVGITACCHVVEPFAAVIVGTVAAMVCHAGVRILHRWKIDDVIGAFPAHGLAGVWGTLAVALFGDVEAIGTGLSRWEQLGVQLAGVGSCFAWAFCVGWTLFAGINHVWPLRASRRAERVGLNAAEHHASTELIDLLGRMGRHRTGGDLRPVAVEPHTEVGQIAAQYNRVLDRIAEEISHRDAAAVAAQTAEEKYRGIFENAVEGIYRSSLDGQFLDVNPSLARILGYESAELLKDELGDIACQFYSDPERREEFILRVERDGTIQNFESVAVQRDGTEIRVCENARAVRDANGRTLYYEGTIEDVTQIRMAEELKREKEAADARDRAKSSFLANMSHEIRTPLNGVVGMLELLGQTQLDDRQLRYSRIATSSAGALLSLINDILDFSKIEAGKLEVEHISFDLNVVLEDVAEMFGQQAVDKGLELTCFVRSDVPTRVSGDPERLRQILINLVGNALKFTDSGEIRIEAARDLNSPFIRLSVKDTGIGIPPDRQLDLFRPFSQLDASTTRKYGGTGLGLAICGQLAELMGGEMSVDSEPGAGARFTCTIPLPAVEDTSDSKPSDHALAGVRVIAVDDNQTNREMLFEQLSAWGIEVEVYSEPRRVLEVLDQNRGKPDRFQLAILDQHMPGTTGVELARAIRKRKEWQDLKLTILSSVDQVIDSSQAAEIGVQAVMSKPIRQSRLFDVIVGVLNEGVTDSGERPTPSGTRRRLVGRVLVAEDNDVNQLFVRELLRGFGVDCEVVANGALAVERLKHERFDVVFMDCQMPVMDGFAATRSIRELEDRSLLAEPRQNHIIALTANAVTGDRERCLAAGMDDYIAKPIDPTILYEKLEEILPADTPVPTSSSVEVRSNDDSETRRIEDQSSAVGDDIHGVGAAVEILAAAKEDCLADVDAVLEQVSDYLPEADPASR